MGYDNTTVANWETIAQPKKEDIKTLIIDIIMRHEKTDIEIVIADTTFRCHLLVLRCYSEYFNNFTDNPKVVSLPSNEVTPTAFYMIYKWMLNPDPTICRESILNFFKAAQYLQIECAASQCWTCICDNQFIEDKAMLLYLEARVLGLKDVQIAMSSRVSKFFLNLVASKDFLDLNVDEVMHFLKSNSIGVHTEIEVTTNSMLSFDPVTMSWFRETDLPVKIKNFGFIAAHLQIYAIGGEDNSDTPSNLVFRYDPVNTSWTELQRMHVKRSRAAVAIHKNHIWVAGGLTDAGITDTVEYYNPITGIWTEAQTLLRVPRCFARLSSVNGGLFIVGGINREGCSLASIDIYDEIWETWKQIEEMEMPRFGHEVCTINTCMIIIGGINSKTGDNISLVECYCNNKMAWTEEVQKFPFPVTGMAGVILPSCYIISLKS
ncbi:hypothetical protein HA402_002810 [Bradysia odoriphaga]|nr:hypothetical protein HA402_002810 [Bradysia odoriphaga]